MENEIIYLKDSDPLAKEARSRGFKTGDKFKSLRNVIAREIETCSPYGINGVIGTHFKFNPKTNTLYTSGYGLYVVMENNIWVGDKINPTNPIYEIY